jgi:hypothetical protein
MGDITHILDDVTRFSPILKTHRDLYMELDPKWGDVKFCFIQSQKNERCFYKYSHALKAQPKLTLSNRFYLLKTLLVNLV